MNTFVEVTHAVTDPAVKFNDIPFGRGRPLFNVQGADFFHIPFLFFLCEYVNLLFVVRFSSVWFIEGWHGECASQLSTQIFNYTPTWCAIIYMGEMFLDRGPTTGPQTLSVKQLSTGVSSTDESMC